MRKIEKTEPPLVVQLIIKQLSAGEFGAVGLTSKPFNTYLKSDYWCLPKTKFKKLEAAAIEEAKDMGYYKGNGRIQTTKILKEFLAKEQGYICCYCNKEIKHEKGFPIEMKIEHYKPQSLFIGKTVTELEEMFKELNKKGEVKQLLSPNTYSQTAPLEDLRIEYSNLLCACTGQHCDDSGHGKGDKELAVIPNPALFKGENLQDDLKIYYDDVFGFIHSEDRAINEELGGKRQDVGFEEGKLNLNSQKLSGARLAIWHEELYYKLISPLEEAEILSEGRFPIKDIPKLTMPQLVDEIKKHEEGVGVLNNILTKRIRRYSKKRVKDDKYYAFCEFMLFQLNQLNSLLKE